MPFAPDGAVAVTDPIFGRDISYFLFELPFLRLVQGLFNVVVIIGLVLAAASATSSRPRAAVSRSARRSASTSRSSAALFLLSVAFGYQLDKYELVYSTRGFATGVSYTDQNAQFFAFDLLTVISGLAAAFLVGGAFTRMLWPLGLTIGVWFVASHRRRPALSGGDPALHGRAQPVRPGRALHRQQHRDDAARLRPRRLGGAAVQRRRAGHAGGRRRR